MSRLGKVIEYDNGVRAKDVTMHGLLSRKSIERIKRIMENGIRIDEQTELEHIKLELECLIGMLQVCAVSFEQENAFSLMNERDVSCTFYSLQNHMQGISDELGRLIKGNNEK